MTTHRLLIRLTTGDLFAVETDAPTACEAVRYITAQLGTVMVDAAGRRFAALSVASVSEAPR